MLKTSEPHVLIFASCFSQESEINDILRSEGLFSVLNVAAERGEITCGNVFKLEPEQQDVLKKIADNFKIKDVIFMGEYLVSLFHVKKSTCISEE